MTTTAHPLLPPLADLAPWRRVSPEGVDLATVTHGDDVVTLIPRVSLVDVVHVRGTQTRHLILTPDEVVDELAAIARGERP